MSRCTGRFAQRWAERLRWSTVLAGAAGLALASCASVDETPQADVAALTDAQLATQAREILTTHCARCHGESSPGVGGFDYVTDLRALVARGKVVPNDPDASPLLQRIEAEQMPPSGRRPTTDEVETLRRWIGAGAPAEATAPQEFVTYPAIEAAVLADLDTLTPAQARSTRYLTVAHYLNAGITTDERDAIVRSVGRIVNSLSRNPELVVPTVVRADLGLYRVALGDYRWSRKTWEDLVQDYPYAALNPSTAGRRIAEKAGSELPIARVDWLAKRGLVPPLYYDFLDIPTTLAEYERKAGFSVLSNIQNRRVIRAGFTGSGVSDHNRVIERHAVRDGAFWLSYDFRSDDGLSNIFLNPVGPGGAFGFVQAGGEAIFNLPNGLQGYLLYDARGARIDEGPTDIVFDPTRPPGTIIAGASCMNCHAGGILPKRNEITVDTVEDRIPASAKRAVSELYPEQATLDQAYAGDTARYVEAITALDARLPPSSSTTNPYLLLVDKYDADIDATRLAAELGVKALEWPEFVRSLPDASLRVAFLPTLGGGSLKRTTVEPLFASAMRYSLERSAPR